MKGTPFRLTAAQALAEMAAGRLSSLALVRSCLERIAETDGTIGAWAHVDGEGALARAEECDRIRKAGLPMGILHGIPVGLKDIIDTRDMPTGRGTPIFAGRQPEADARIVERLREEGAIILGKTVTTELAFVHAAGTRNPLDHERTPGGSSSGSAAAVAAWQVPLAVGTQTNGSVIRPASFCGTFGFKPTSGVIPRTGLLQTSVTLDQVGTFGRSLTDVALLADALKGYDQRDPLSHARPHPAFAEGAAEDVPVPPDLAWFDMPYHDRLSEAAHEGFEGILGMLGDRVTRMSPARTLAGLVEVRATIHQYEICQHLGGVFDEHWDQISDTLKPIVESGRGISQLEYEDALEVKRSAENFFAEFFREFDAILAPSAAGEAPAFGGGTGDPVFCTVWTLAGLPCVTLPLLVGESGLPVGVQLIGPAERDGRLLRTARWLQKTLAA
ncbi:amidase [Sulfitobacter sp. LCG007]